MSNIEHKIMCTSWLVEGPIHNCFWTYISWTQANIMSTVLLIFNTVYKGHNIFIKSSISNYYNILHNQTWYKFTYKSTSHNLIRLNVFWDITLVPTYQHYGQTTALIFCTEDGSIRVLWNYGNQLPHYMMLHPEDSTFYSQHCETLKSCIIKKVTYRLSCV
jgi:hypothetical protein